MAWDLAPASVLKLVLNRLVRTRMPGGVGGVPGQPGPLSRSLVLQEAVFRWRANRTVTRRYNAHLDLATLPAAAF
jgi:hypothetical protein